MTHRHRADPTLEREHGYSHCVTPHTCNPSAHGWIMRIDTCRCGAERWSNQNQHHVEMGPWVRDVTACCEVHTGGRDD